MKGAYYLALFTVMAVLLGMALGAKPAQSAGPSCFIVCIHPVHFYLPLIALYLDDWLTGDDDEWKRFWQVLRNKVKWKMVLPQLQPQRTAR